MGSEETYRKMEAKEIIDTINGILINDFEISKEIVKPQAKLVDDLAIDSLDFIDFVVAIDKNFGIKVKGEDLKNVRTVGDLHNFIISKKRDS